LLSKNEQLLYLQNHINPTVFYIRQRKFKLIPKTEISNENKTFDIPVMSELSFPNTENCG